MTMAEQSVSVEILHPTPINARRRSLLMLASASMLMSYVAPAHAAVELEGVALTETVTAYGQTLVLNGAGVRKRGYFKTEVAALYLPEKHTTPDAIYKLSGIRRLQLNFLREIKSSVLSRVFLSDFKQTALADEAKKLIGPISVIGAAYADVGHVGKGDVVNLDWVPGTGWMATHNGKPLTGADGKALLINEELAFQIYLRMYIGSTVPEELRNGLLGR